jgi:hypothetical protein
MGDSKVEIKIPEQLIEDMIRSKIVEQIGTGHELVKRIVESACDKKDSSWNKKTILQKAFEEMIRNEAKKIFREWIDTNREAFREAFIAQLSKQKNARLKKLANSVIDEMCGFSVQVRLRESE